MKFSIPQTLEDVATILGCDFVGDTNFAVLGMNEIHVVEPGDIVFVDHPKYYDKALNSAATIILINKEVDCPEGKALLISDDPFRDFNKLTDTFKPFVKSESTLSDSASVGENTIIQPNCFVGHNVFIGKNCTIHSNVSIYDDTIIGDNVTIHSGTVLGANAFYYKKRSEGYDRLKSSGRVVIEDNVDIGASCTIDRGVTADTTIGVGSKLDNQIQIGHNVEIGENTAIAGLTAVAGSTKIGKNCLIGGQCAITGHIKIGDNVRIAGNSGIGGNIKDNQTVQGIYAFNKQDFQRSYIHFKRLPKLAEEFNKLKKDLSK